MEGGISLTLVLCVVLVLGLGVPASLYLSARRGGGAQQIELWKRAGDRARNPWKAEDDNLEELARKVDALKDDEKD